MSSVMCGSCMVENPARYLEDADELRAQCDCGEITYTEPYTETHA